jgi:ABC-type enterochelin transport system permease subunit
MQGVRAIVVLVGLLCVNGLYFLVKVSKQQQIFPGSICLTAIKYSGGEILFHYRATKRHANGVQL